MNYGKTPTVLVVDDQPINTKLLQRRLQREDMRVTTAANGIECLKSVEEDRPDLILLDVMMPEMDGIEACKRLKADPKTRDIPVIFITARTSQEGKIEGLRTGATDYITKPIDLEETLARVNTQLSIQRAYRENLNLQQRLNDIRRSAAIGSITQGISHNLNNLLGVVVGYLDLLKHSLDNPEAADRSINAMDNAIQRMVKLIRELSRIASEEDVPRSDCSLVGLINSSLNRFKKEYNRDEPIHVENLAGLDFVFSTNPEVFESILCRLLINAFEACDKTDREPLVRLQCEVQKVSGEAFLRICVSDNGMGIDDQIHETLFEPFVSTQTAVGRGLGLTLVRHAVRTLKGSVDFESKEGEGVSMILMLPREGSVSE